jgi:cell division protein FtsI/penicillin-binding protein 2
MVRRQKNTSSFHGIRLNMIIFGAVFFAGAIVFRLFTLQVFQHDYYVALAQNQHYFVEHLLPKRGEIFFQEYGTDNLFPAATNQKLHFLYSVPRDVPDDEYLLNQMIDILQTENDVLDRYQLFEQEKEELDAAALVLQEEELERRREKERGVILQRLSKKNDLYEPIKRQVTDAQREKIEALDIPGLHFVPEDFRFYPEAQLASHVLGFVGFRDDVRVGQYGIEGYYNEQLEGRGGRVEAEKDTAGRFITTGSRTVEKSRDGASLILTIDRVVQHQVEKRLRQAVEDFEADSGTIIIMDPRTGEIISLANYPSFDPNRYSKVESVGMYSNRAIRDVYEPGSIFKPINMASAIDAGLINPDTVYNDEGSKKIDVFTIRNSDRKAHGRTTMTEVLESSLNLGMIFVMEHLGRDRAYDYLQQFGFDELTGIDLDTESENRLQSVQKINEVELATIGFGQGIAMTPLQFLSAFSVIANDGKLVKPHVVDAFVTPDGERVDIAPQEVRQVISSKAASQVGAMLVSVVERGSGRRTKIDGYRIAAKTGTAQVPSADRKGYDPNKKIVSFAGFAPFEDPAFSILVKLDNPKTAGGGEIWAENTAGFVFRDLTEFLLRYYQIPPSH